MFFVVVVNVMAFTVVVVMKFVIVVLKVMRTFSIL